MQPRAQLVGNSDGIGLAPTKRLLAAGWEIAFSGIKSCKKAALHSSDVRQRSRTEIS